jgi:regulatory protein
LSKPQGPPDPPAHATIHEAALAYLERRPATAALLRRVLERRVAAWALRAARAGVTPSEIADVRERAREAIGAVVARLVEVGLVNDASFATSRAERLGRAGKSTRAIAAYLASKGVDRHTLRAALERGPRAELAAAISLARRRRIGPFAREEADRQQRQKELAVLGRAGFERSVAERALAMDRAEAEEILRADPD